MKKLLQVSVVSYALAIFISSYAGDDKGYSCANCKTKDIGHQH